MMWIALAAVAQIAAPVPVNPIQWFSYDDVPYYLISKGNGLWFVKVRIGVDTDGKLVSCQVEGSSGIRELDAFTCRTILQRAKFYPAKRADGSPAFGVYRTSVKWAVADAPRDITKLSNPDLDVTVRSLPQSVKSPALVNVMFQVDEAGRMSSCIAEPDGSFGRPDNDPTLVPVACDLLFKNYRPIPAKDAAGNVIASVQDALVRFTVSHS